jgi:hypothetical protein
VSFAGTLMPEYLLFMSQLVVAAVLALHGYTDLHAPGGIVDAAILYSGLSPTASVRAARSLRSLSTVAFINLAAAGLVPLHWFHLVHNIAAGVFYVAIIFHACARAPSHIEAPASASTLRPRRSPRLWSAAHSGRDPRSPRHGEERTPRHPLTCITPYSGGDSGTCSTAPRRTDSALLRPPPISRRRASSSRPALCAGKSSATSLFLLRRTPALTCEFMSRHRWGLIVAYAVTTAGTLALLALALVSNRWAVALRRTYGPLIEWLVTQLVNASVMLHARDMHLLIRYKQTPRALAPSGEARSHVPSGEIKCDVPVSRRPHARTHLRFSCSDTGGG